MSILLDGRNTTIVEQKNGGYVYVDTCWTMDHGWETMVFACNANGKVTSWQGLDCDLYRTKEEASEGHYSMIDKWQHK